MPRCFNFLHWDSHQTISNFTNALTRRYKIYWIITSFYSKKIPRENIIEQNSLVDILTKYIPMERQKKALLSKGNFKSPDSPDQSSNTRSYMQNIIPHL